MKNKSKIYNILKWVVFTALPAICTLITGLGLLYAFDTRIIVGTISLAATFLGTVIGISSERKEKESEE